MSSSSYELQGDAPDSSVIEEPWTSIYGSSEIGPSSPQIQDLTLVSSPPPIQRKRKRVEPWAWNKRENHLRRANAQPIMSYWKILEETVDAFIKEPNRGAVIHGSRFGMITWSSEEKLALFAALGRKGKSAISEIASIIGTKSRLEVQEYLFELQQALQEKHMTEKTVRGVTLSDIHAAAEISEECCLALENVANSLSVREEQAHNISGRRKYQNMWLVDRTAALYLEEKVKTKEISDVDPSAHHMLATAQLFNILNWVNLSRNVFMNFGGRRIEDNWTKICFHDETPAITCDSFTDFYTLAVSLTRRLVQSSIFFALSRIRTMEERGWNRHRFVRKDDVQAALKTLNVQANSREFWVNAARRCSLDVREYVSKGSSKTMLLSYDEVERRLSSSHLELPELPEVEDHAENPIHDANIPSKQSQERDILEDSTSLFEGSDSDTSMDESAPVISDDEFLSGEEDRYASTLDKETSHEEEKRLWEILNQAAKTKSAPPAVDIKMESDDEEKLSPSHRRVKPPAKRKTAQELRDWRDYCLPMAEWELFGSKTVHINEEIRENHCIKRRKIGDDG
ncbi:uncharacterized protein GIQ15_02102 [Arthroderma uncinatum]|uniref:uncharacterized protein n=1 Tax=Arthroderma uncinatum TaxID=74035 RepID=UPI00144A865F|nr:uncharacterized protein GIQ15_02102 [Arthroderma uncinatum]KAF3482778.1 hypothetical protein GIQ15_02102 [Arthroderma uncinatum]